MLHKVSRYPSATPFFIAASLASCNAPSDAESASSDAGGSWRDKLTHPDALLEDEALQSLVAVVFSDLPEQETCEEADVACTDTLLLRRQVRNELQLSTLMADAPDVGYRGLEPVWYELPQKLSTGETVPIGTAFSLLATPAEVQAMAVSSVVKAIGPAPWVGGGLTTEKTQLFDCPTQMEEDPSKADGLVSIKGKGPQPVLFHVRLDGVLPPAETCTESTEACQQAQIARAWERAVLHTRHLTCIGQWVDLNVQDVPARVDEGAVQFQTVSGLPPFGGDDALHSLRGLVLDWATAKTVASHPYVERATTDEHLEGTPAETCAPDLSAPITTPECTEKREPIEDKLSPGIADAFQEADGPLELILFVRGGAEGCNLDLCQVSCPVHEDVHDFWIRQNAAAQHCVRELITDLGGEAEPAEFWLTNSFSVSLTWEQLQAVAALPDVEHVGQGWPTGGLL